MNLNGLRNAITSKTARPLLILSKHSPKILFVAGTVGVIGTVVLACRATLKTQEVLDDHEKQHANLVGATVDAVVDRNDMNELDRNQKLDRQLQVKTAVKIVKLYAPAIGLGALSIGALTGSHFILSRRNGALMATAAGLSRAYQEYRQRVSDEYGEDVDKRFAIGATNVDVEEKLADGSTRVTKNEKVDGKSGSPYRYLFDPVNSRKWSREPGRNAMTLQMQQQYANDKLRANGHLFLNEVLDMLGIQRTKVGAVVGWVYRHDSEEKTGDNYVDFGIYDTDLDRAEAFVDGAESSVWMNFNVDGVILELI